MTLNRVMVALLRNSQPPLAFQPTASRGGHNPRPLISSIRWRSIPGDDAKSLPFHRPKDWQMNSQSVTPGNHHATPVHRLPHLARCIYESSTSTVLGARTSRIPTQEQSIGRPLFMAPLRCQCFSKSSLHTDKITGTRLPLSHMA